MSKVEEHAALLQVKGKSTVVGVLLTIFLGPIGLFYSSIVGGVVMSLFALLCLTKFFALLIFLGFIFWPILWAVCIIWSCVAISIHNNNLIEEYDDSSSKKSITQQSTDILDDTEGIARGIFSLLVIAAFIYLILKLLNLKF